MGDIGDFGSTVVVAHASDTGTSGLRLVGVAVQVDVTVHGKDDLRLA